MNRPLSRSFLSWIDRSWPVVVAIVVGGGVGGGYALAAAESSSPIMIGRLDPGTRGVLYGSIGTSAGALLGLVIAAIAILMTLDPSREAVHEMQSIRAWRILNVTFLVAAAFLAITLVVSTIVLGVDSGKRGIPGLEMAVAAVAAVAFAELAVATAAFAVVVLNITRTSRIAT